MGCRHANTKVVDEKVIVENEEPKKDLTRSPSPNNKQNSNEEMNESIIERILELPMNCENQKEIDAIRASSPRNKELYDRIQAIFGMNMTCNTNEMQPNTNNKQTNENHSKSQVNPSLIQQSLSKGSSRRFLGVPSIVRVQQNEEDVTNESTFSKPESDAHNEEGDEGDPSCLRLKSSSLIDSKKLKQRSISPDTISAISKRQTERFSIFLQKESSNEVGPSHKVDILSSNNLLQTPKDI